jgi:cytochrome c peroxidase
MTLINPYRTDYVLITDKSFKKYAKAYADDEALFFKE